MTSIEKIRAEVEGIRKEHQHYEGEDVKIGPLCGSIDCASVWPCPTLRLAEDKLRLAEWIEASDSPSELIERVLAEVAR